MPKLVAFFVCEKVIFEKQHETPSVISIVQRVQFQAAESEEQIPKDALAPMPWQIFTMWMHDTEDQGKKFIQKSEFVFPDGSPSAMPAALRFTASEMYSTNAIRSVGFPIGHDRVQVKMWLESETGEKASPEHFYTVQVQQIPKE